MCNVYELQGWLHLFFQVAVNLNSWWLCLEPFVVTRCVFSFSRLPQDFNLYERQRNAAVEINADYHVIPNGMLRVLFAEFRAFRQHECLCFSLPMTGTYIIRRVLPDVGSLWLNFVVHVSVVCGSALAYTCTRACTCSRYFRHLHTGVLFCIMVQNLFLSIHGVLVMYLSSV